MVHNAAHDSICELGLRSVGVHGDPDAGVRTLEQDRAIRLRRILARAQQTLFGRPERVLQFASQSFDVSIGEIFGSPDDLKVRSSMTLFARATQDNQDFVQLLERYYDGEEDPLTVARLT